MDQAEGQSARTGRALPPATDRLFCPIAGVKYECVYLHAFETGSELPAGLARWIGYYNADRPHSALGGKTPDEAYAPTTEDTRLAA